MKKKRMQRLIDISREQRQTEGERERRRERERERELMGSIDKVKGKHENTKEVTCTNNKIFTHMGNEIKDNSGEGLAH